MRLTRRNDVSFRIRVVRLILILYSVDCMLLALICSQFGLAYWKSFQTKRINAYWFDGKWFDSYDKEWNWTLFVVHLLSAHLIWNYPPQLSSWKCIFFQWKSLSSSFLKNKNESRKTVDGKNLVGEIFALVWWITWQCVLLGWMPIYYMLRAHIHRPRYVCIENVVSNSESHEKINVCLLSVNL